MSGLLCPKHPPDLLIQRIHLTPRDPAVKTKGLNEGNSVDPLRVGCPNLLHHGFCFHGDRFT